MDSKILFNVVDKLSKKAQKNEWTPVILKVPKGHCTDPLTQSFYLKITDPFYGEISIDPTGQDKITLICEEGRCVANISDKVIVKSEQFEDLNDGGAKK